MKSRSLGCQVGCWLGAAATVLCAGAAKAQERPQWVDPHANVVADEVVGNGYRRVYRTEVEQVTPEQLAQMIAEGKEFEIDPATGGVIRHTFTDYLPKGWQMEPPADGSRVDSYGNPIVNDVQGLPAWSQRNVDALRGQVASWRDKYAAALASGNDVKETAGNLGNFLGQALTRDIRVDDLVRLEDSSIVDNQVAQAVIDYLHFYESERVNKQEIFHYTYTPTQYSARVAAFVAAHGTTLAAVQHVDPAQTFGDRGAGCYDTTTFARGMTNLATFTDIWNASNTDDASSDIATGFGQFFFYSCSDADFNDTVRVSTNGYQSFFQQGGNATIGTDFSNIGIPDATAGNPDGFIGPWWDDLHVMPAQGTPDRISYSTEGATGNRVFTVEYFSVSHHLGTTNEFYYFQTKLYEISDVMEMHYSTLWINGGAGEESATIGNENYDGLSGLCGPNCSAANTDAPASNYRYTYFRPFNDTCASAGTLYDGNNFSGTLHRAANNASGTGCSSDYNRDVWYRFVAPCAGDLNVNMCGSYDGGGVDTVVSAFSGCPASSANSLACNDQGGTGCSANDSQINIVGMTDGQEVFIRVSNFSSTPNWFQNGSFTGHLTFTETGPVPFNDSSATPIVLTADAAGGQDLGCATNDGSTNCGSSSGNRDLWYEFITGCPGTLTVNTDGSNALSDIDTVLSAHSAVPGNAANTITCDDDGGTGLDSNIVVAMSAGQHVFVRASHFGSRTGNGQFHISFTFVSSAPIPANDTCAGATPIACNASFVASNCGATSDVLAAGPCGFDPSNGVWYSVVGDGNAFAASTCGAETSFDTLLHVYSGSCGALVPVECNDDSTCSFSSLSSRVSWGTTPGVTYYIVVSSFSGVTTGDFRLTISNGGRPFNDDCSGAFTVPVGSYVGNIRCATPDGATSCTSTSGNRSVWYRFVAPADGTLTVDTCGSRNTGGFDAGVDTVISAYAGSCAGPQVLCNDEGGTGCNIHDSRITGPMSAGQVVLVRLTHWGGPDNPTWIANGNYVINFNFAGCDSIDWNNDGLFPDTQDITDFISVFGGGFCAPPNPPACNSDIDFNNDGLFPDTDDITAFITAFGGGACP